MRIFIPYQIMNIGGPMSFVRLLSQELKRIGHTVTFKFQSDFDILLIISSCPLRYILYAKWHGKPVIQRLDGVYHPGISGLNGYLYWWKNWRTQLIHNYLADGVIYQSKFSKKSCRQFLGQPRGTTTLIYNGTILSNQTISHKLHQPVRLIAYANWRRRDQIEPLLQATTYLPSDFQLTLYGPHTSAVADLFNSLEAYPLVQYKGPLSHDELLAKLFHYDIFLFADQSACPNSVLEALGAHLPVVAYNRGATPELIKPGINGELVTLPLHNPYQDHYPFTVDSYEQFAQAIQKIVTNYSHYTQEAGTVAQVRFDIQKIVTHYVQYLSRLS